MFDLPPLAVAALVPLYACADRLWGAANPAFVGKKAVIALAVLGAGYVLAGWPFAALGAVWLVYRSLPFKGGAGAPIDDDETKAAIVRHALIIPLPVFIALGSHGLPAMMCSLMVLYAVAAIGLAVWYGHAVALAQENSLPIGAENVVVELARGAAFGAALSTYAILT